MYECVVFSHFLRLHPEKTDDYLATFHAQWAKVLRAVITLRDVDGLSAGEVAEMLEISDGNQRVLLHRARAKVRAALEDYFGAVEPTLDPLEAE